MRSIPVWKCCCSRPLWAWARVGRLFSLCLPVSSSSQLLELPLTVLSPRDFLCADLGGIPHPYTDARYRLRPCGRHSHVVYSLYGDRFPPRGVQLLATTYAPIDWNRKHEHHPRRFVQHGLERVVYGLWRTYDSFQYRSQVRYHGPLEKRN